MTAVAIRAAFLHCVRDPGLDGSDAGAVEHLRDGVMVIRDGRIERLAPADALLPTLGADVAVHDLRGRIVVPGFVDVHVHFPQVDVIASHGTQLLDWLERYTFPAERRFADAAHAAEAATFFVDRLLENGTTTASVFCTVHATSVDAFMAEARRRGLLMIAGKCAMDRHAPDGLRDTAESSYAEAKALIERWHGVDRLRYAVTPRFAPTSTPEQLTLCGRLAAEHPGVHVQSHVAENRDEVAWAARLFPERRSYLDVYDHHGLLRERAVYAHCIWLDDADRARMTASGTAVAFCPTSNLFIGSGLYDLARGIAAGHRIGLGTDVGGGTSYSMLRTLGEAYKVQQLLGTSMHPAYALYLATLGGARSLYLDDRIGSLAPGRDADLAVLDPAATPLLARRTGLRDDPLDAFFALAVLGDDRAIEQTWVAGVPVHRRP
ncbi:MAG TPA: guanine deaminase [Burkholderiaceae bacterium]|nr:guanine deaminase [Burkholderiaceae bacterium]